MTKQEPTTRPDVRPCAGTCGRSTCPRRWKVAGEHIRRETATLCPKCAKDAKRDAARALQPPVPDDDATKWARINLGYWQAERRARLGQMVSNA